jgi:hypothetical protein
MHSAVNSRPSGRGYKAHLGRRTPGGERPCAVAVPAILRGTTFLYAVIRAAPT